MDKLKQTQHQIQQTIKQLNKTLYQIELESQQMD